MALPFFGGKFFGGGFFGRAVQGGYGAVLGWKDYLKDTHEQREAERQLKKAKSEVKKVHRQIKAAEKKVAKAPPSRPPEGILANLHRLAERREELRLVVQKLEVSLDDIQTLLIASGRMKEYEDDEDDAEAMLLA